MLVEFWFDNKYKYDNKIDNINYNSFIFVNFFLSVARSNTIKDLFTFSKLDLNKEFPVQSLNKSAFALETSFSFKAFDHDK